MTDSESIPDNSHYDNITACSAAKPADGVTRILEVLKDNPRGVNIREIAEATKLNRMSVAKYLEVLTALEITEVRNLGNAKLYYLSQRLPVTTFRQLTSKPFFVLNRDAVVLQVNDALYSQYIGLPREEIIGVPIFRHIKNRMVDPGAWVKAFEKALAGQEITLEVGDQFNGTITWYNVTMRPIRFPDGSPGVIVTGDDNITETKRIGTELRESEEKFCSLVENINDIIFSVDMAGILTYISPQAARYGYSPADLIGKHFDQIISPEDIGLIFSHFMNIRESGLYLHGVLFRAPAADGRILWLEGNGMIQQDTSGTYTSINGVLRDVTDRVLAERALTEFRSRYDALADTFSGIVAINPENHRIEYMSERFIRHRGRDATGEYCHKAFYNLDTVCPWCIAGRVAAGERIVQYLKSRREGQLYQKVNTPVTHGDGSVSVTITINEIDPAAQDAGILPAP
ncbi:PAS domain S-box protein [Methanoregula sp.]|uniref:PAS domain-containing protein n=1 Tax=Methanoregula sp. TaxID=2052170 RepID=UPI003C785043